MITENSTVSNIIAELNKHDLITPGTAMILERNLKVAIGPILVRLLTKSYSTRIELGDLSLVQFCYLISYNIFMIYYPGLGIKRMRELRLSMRELLYRDGINLPLGEFK